MQTSWSHRSKFLLVPNSPPPPLRLEHPITFNYHDLMMDNIDEITDKRLKALKQIEKDKLRVARAYNKKVKIKSFQVGDLVWKTILPLGMKSNKFGKWSPSWEGP